jgi:hypothetical protein
MNNFELIDDYLTNRLSGENKIAFEKQVDSDPSLKADLELQKAIVESVKKARAAELKTMLQNVPLGGGAGLTQFSVMKMAAGIVGAGLLIAALSYYFSHSNEDNPNLSTSLEDSIKKVNPSEFEPLEEAPAAKPLEDEKSDPSTELESKAAVKPVEGSVAETPGVGHTPKVEVIDPTKEMMEDDSRPMVNRQMTKSPLTISQIGVDVVANDRKFDFHYQFSKDMLVLYGVFDKSLYEILEINGETHSVFMFYKEQYYLLDEKQTKITPLHPIVEDALVSKLNEYRGRK